MYSSLNLNFRLIVSTEVTVSLSNNEELKSTQGISLGKIQVVDQYQTYIDPITGVKPGELTVSVPVTVSEEGISDAYIVIPYGGCIPSIDNPVFIFIFHNFICCIIRNTCIFFKRYRMICFIIFTRSYY